MLWLYSYCYTYTVIEHVERIGEHLNHTYKAGGSHSTKTSWAWIKKCLFKQPFWGLRCIMTTALPNVNGFCKQHTVVHNSEEQHTVRLQANTPLGYDWDSQLEYKGHQMFTVIVERQHCPSQANMHTVQWKEQSDKTFFFTGCIDFVFFSNCQKDKLFNLDTLHKIIYKNHTFRM